MVKDLQSLSSNRRTCTDLVLLGRVISAAIFSLEKDGAGPPSIIVRSHSSHHWGFHILSFNERCKSKKQCCNIALRTLRTPAILLLVMPITLNSSVPLVGVRLHGIALGASKGNLLFITTVFLRIRFLPIRLLINL